MGESCQGLNEGNDDFGRINESVILERNEITTAEFERKEGDNDKNDKKDSGLT